MKLKKRVPSGREKDEEAIEMLERLREKVYCENSSVARHAAFNLSWMQEDGLEILKEALFGNASRTTKGAAAYGLRKMRGRMKKVALGLLEEGLKHSNEKTRQVCAHAKQLLQREKDRVPKKPSTQTQPKRRGKPRFKITEISHESRRGVQKRGKKRPPHISRFNR